MKKNVHTGSALLNAGFTVARTHQWLLLTGIVLTFQTMIVPVDARTTGKYSASIGISPGLGLSANKILRAQPAFSASRPLYHLTLGTDIAGAYRLNSRFTLSLRNATDWYHPGFVTMLNNNLLLESTYAFSGTPKGVSAGLGAGIGTLIYPFDRYWNSHYGAWGPSVSLFTGYPVGNRFDLSLHTIASFPQNKNIVLINGQDHSDIILQYLFIDVRFMITYKLFL